MTAGMVVFNYFITPYFITPDIADAAAVAANRDFVKTLLVPVIIPFNLIKAGSMAWSPSWSTRPSPATWSMARVGRSAPS